MKIQKSSLSELSRIFPPMTLWRTPLVIGVVALLAVPYPVAAGSITISNLIDNNQQFLTNVSGGITLFQLNQTHTLVDLPGTPWLSSSVIFEDAGFFADSLTVNWTFRHLTGPDPEDVNPNALITVLPLTFTAAVVGAFSVSTGLIPVPHPTTGIPHFDDFMLSIAGNVFFETLPTPIPGRLNIRDYTATYSVTHRDPAPPPPPPPPQPVPEPGTAFLLAFGFAILGWMVKAKRQKA